ncbi:hypothetical protein [Halocynthiibacter styelae]|uniref:Uncharacterized protein n=1 Tax=Halocynthiibacter styelae TaxID=2761955 RepID=A0A8J7IFX5_9RHOB|nr:hypothetical protein [Paenihalocynthiibacter styelae]MBI1495402.1 hypothetical protein [Paenihalocynthiibacter styelae]
MPEKKDQGGAPQKYEYEVVSSFWDGPHYREAGKKTVFKTADEAKYFTPHILRLKDAAQPAAGDLQKKTKGKG